MTRRLSWPLRLVITAVLLSVFFTWAPAASAQGIQVWDGNCVINDVPTIQGFGCMLRNVFAVAITFIGLGAFVMLLVAAFRLMISGGDTKATQGARDTITYAVVGIVVALAAFIILNLISSFTGVNQIKNFVIPESGTGALSP